MKQTETSHIHRLKRGVAMLMLPLLVRAGASVAGAESGQARAFGWRKASPASQGMDEAKLEAMKDALASRGTKAFLVIRNDRIVCEWYQQGHGPDKKHYTASMAKAIVGGLSLAVAISDGLIALDDQAVKYVPQWKGDPRKSKITIRQLGSHTSGIEDAEADNLPHDKLTGWKGDFWKRPAPPRDPFTLARDAAAVLFEPGEKMAYSNPGIAMLTYCVTASLRNAPHKDIRTLLRDRIMRPVGVGDKEWSIGYGRTYVVDGLPLVGSWGGGGYTARAVARVGRLMLREGNWEGAQLINAEAVRQVTRDAGTPGNCGIGWWNNNEAGFPELPRDAFWGSGAGHQVVFVVPSLSLIAVRNGSTLDAESNHHEALRVHLFRPLVQAVTDAPGTERETAYIRSDESRQAHAPYPPSTFVEGITFRERIIDGVTSGDQWATTWADDGHLYSAWGDGTGFGYRGDWNDRWTTYLGVPRVEGYPPNHKGRNIWGGYQPESDAPAYYRNRELDENLKPNSSLVCIDSVLYLYAVRRKAGTHGEWSLCRLLTSEDHARTWTDHGVLFEEPKGRFANVFTVQYGKDYTGIASFQGDYAYLYGMENKNQKVNKGLLLARCDKRRLKERDAYEFFSGTPEKPSWTEDLSKAKSVFHCDDGVSWWASCTYNNPLGRYILITTHPPFAGRFNDHKGFGMFESQRPWGPWKTLVYTRDVGNIIDGMTEGISYVLPSKWISDGGKTMWMVFAGRPSNPFYSFNLIKLRLQLACEK
jgi:CubicO group peptidase (beta-lactamase class C family)